MHWLITILILMVAATINAMSWTALSWLMEKVVYVLILTLAIGPYVAVFLEGVFNGNLRGRAWQNVPDRRGA